MGKISLFMKLLWFMRVCLSTAYLEMKELVEILEKDKAFLMEY